MGAPRHLVPKPARRLRSALPYVWALAVSGAATALCRAMTARFDLADLIMVYLLGVVVVASRFGRGPASFASVLSVAAFDFFFVPPHLTFAVTDAAHLLTFAVMLAVGLIIAALTERVRLEGHAAREREQRTEILFAMSKDLAVARETGRILEVAAAHIQRVVPAKVEVLLPDKEGTPTVPGASVLHLPLVASRGTVGVVRVEPIEPIEGGARSFDADLLHLLEMLANQTALAVERALVVEEAQRAAFEAERERLRSSLLSSVSHDLRTPLAVITGATSTLLNDEPKHDEATRRELMQTVYEEAERLNRLVGNLLDMTRLESGVRVKKEWQPLDEVVGAALTHLEPRLLDRSVRVIVPPDLPLVPVDGVVIELVVRNLLENAIKYSPPGTPIEIRADHQGSEVLVTVEDNGHGLKPGDEERIFEKFYRTPQHSGASGVGLGLAIARAVVTAHGGRIWAERRAAGGALFHFTIPLEGDPPSLDAERPPSDPGRRVGAP